jgi:tetratricopeptide (TPR) repeat protein
VEHLQGPLRHERFGLFVLPSSFSRSFLAWAHAELGEFAEGAPIGQEGVQFADSAGHAFSSGYARLGMGVLLLRQGELQRAIFEFERALAMSGFADLPVGYAYVAFHLGYALALAGRADEGLPLLEKTIELAEAKGFVARHALRLAYLGEVYLLADRVEDAARAAARALQFALDHRERANQAYALRLLGDIEARRGGRALARDHLNAALTLAQELGMRPLLAHCHWSLARVLEEDRAAGVHRDSAYRLFQAMGMRFWTQRMEIERAAWH